MWWRNARRQRCCGRGPSARQRKRCSAALSAAIEQCEPRYLLSVVQPTIVPTTVFNITSYGAVDTAANNASSIQGAIAAANANRVVIGGVTYSGGIVEIPAAAQDWLTGPITLASNVDLQIDAGATLQALAMANYPGEGGSSVTNFITSSSSTSNLEITGSGTIDGNGAAWWAAYNANKNIGRPYLIKISSSSTFLIQGVTLQNSPMFDLAFGNANNVTVNGITISNPSTAPNTDGIDPAGSHYLIENCNISTGDDDIAVKPQDVFCSDITIENCTIGTGHGISVGGETNDGLNGMTVTNITFTNTTDGLRLKAGRGAGSGSVHPVENITYSNIVMNGVQYPIYITSYYLNGGDTQPSNPASDPGQTVTSTTPFWENITFSNITSTDNSSSAYDGILYGLPEAPISNVVFDNVKLSTGTKGRGLEVNNTRNVTFGDGSTLTDGNGGDLIATSSVATPYNDTVLGEGYSDQDLGAPATAGTTLFDPDTSLWSIIAGGAGIGGASDQFNFASTSVTGNATYFAKVTSLSTANANAVAGVMFRDSSDTTTAAFADAVVTPTGGVMFQWRNANGGATGSTTVAGIAAPVWLEVVRSGSSFSAFYSSNGTTWTQIGTAQTITMSSNALVGLAVSATNNSSTSTAGFSNVSGPTTSTPAAASSTSVNGNSTALSVVGADSTGASGLTYTWSAAGPAAVTYTGNTNGTNAAKNITANFTAAGLYDFTVTITDSDGLSTNALINVLVNQTPTAITVSPSTASLAANATKVFTATATDQFGAAMAPEPVFAWSLASGVGSINSSFGLYTAGASAGTATVKATAGSASGTATVTIGPTVATPAAATPNPVTGTSTALSALGSENGSDAGLSYTWAATGPASVSYSGNTNGTNAAKNITANFTQAGSYNFTVTITDSGGLFTTSSVAVTVQQTPTGVIVTPSSATVATGGTKQFSASATDQFGNAISPGAPGFNWSITGTSNGNSINAAGLATLGSTPGTYTVTATLGSASNNASVTAATAPIVSAFQVNDGNVQRAMVDSLTVTFNEPVTLSGGAITLNLLSQTGGSPTPITNFNLNSPDGGTTWVLTFTDPSYIGGSLPDGAYELIVSAGGVTSGQGLNMSADQNFTFWRLYGDFQGNGTVNGSDFTLLVTELGTQTNSSDWYLDYEGQGTVSGSDFTEFVTRLGDSISIPALPSVELLAAAPAVTTRSSIDTANADMTILTAKTSKPAPQKDHFRHRH
ncbi:MAG: glycosyl hydrolase family 28 protein [Tepidisphaeraceae bacterium]